MGYYTMTSPYELTINEQLERDAIYNEQQDILHHYLGSIKEFKTGEFHVCKKCRPQQVRDYFRRFNQMTEADAQELQELDANLSITEMEYNLNQQGLDRAANDLYKEFSF